MGATGTLVRVGKGSVDIISLRGLPRWTGLGLGSHEVLIYFAIFVCFFLGEGRDKGRLDVLMDGVLDIHSVKFTAVAQVSREVGFEDAVCGY